MSSSSTADPTDGAAPAAVITGSQGGIGQALCAHFRAAGYFVIGTDLAPHNGGCDAYLAADLRAFACSEDERTRFATELMRLSAGHPIKVLVNNAAVQILGSAEGMTPEDLRTTLDVNLVAPALLIQQLLPHLAAHDGAVVNIGSIHSRLTKPEFVAYATSKAGPLGLTQALAVDTGSRVRFNIIEPAAIATPMLIAGFADQPEGLSRLESYHPVKHIGQAEDVASVAAFLASDQARFLNGAIVNLDGGISSRLHDPS